MSLESFTAEEPGSRSTSLSLSTSREHHNRCTTAARPAVDEGVHAPTRHLTGPAAHSLTSYRICQPLSKQPELPTTLIRSVARVQAINPYNRNNIKVLLFPNSFLGESNQNTLFTIFLIGYAHWDANKIRTEFCSISNLTTMPLIFL